MQHFSDAVRTALDNENYYAALAVALMLPDIAGDAERKPPGKARYIAWCEKHLNGTTPVVDSDRDDAVSGADYYQLRCSFLHAGRDVADRPSHISRFEFVVPAAGMIAHCNLRKEGEHEVIQLDIRITAREFADGFEKWIAAAGEDHATQQRIADCMTIELGHVPKDPLSLGRRITMAELCERFKPNDD